MSETEGLESREASGKSVVRDKVSPTKRLSSILRWRNCTKERLAVENSHVVDRVSIKSHRLSCVDAKFAIDNAIARCNSSPAESRSSKIELKCCAGKEIKMKSLSPAERECSKL